MNPWWWRINLVLKISLLLKVSLLLKISLLLWLAPPSAGAALPSFQEVKSSFIPSEGRLLDRKGKLLQEVRLVHQGRALEWTSLSRMSPALIKAVLQVEDRRFYSHGGVDPVAVAGALWERVTGSGRRGASTISMQLVNALVPELRGPKSLWDKVRQGSLALELEKSWSKEEILEAYLNLVTFRGEQQGVAAASRALFQKDPHGLNSQEGLLLAALLKAPGMGVDEAGQRVCVLAGESGERCQILQAFVQESLREVAIERRVSLAPHLARKLLGKDRPKVRSTLDASLQRLAQSLVAEQVSSLSSQNTSDGAVIVLHNKTGEVLAYVGGSGRYSASPAVDMAAARRQAGSTLKPFLYGTALERGYLRPNSWILDEPFELSVEGRGGYRPENYDRTFHGPVSLAVALGSSLNIPAVRTADLIGVEAFWSSLEKAGFRELKAPEDYGASLALGTADITLLELANAYRALANGGLWSPVRFTAGEKGKTRRVFRESVASTLSGILASRENRALTFGWSSVLSTPYSAAVKTGTSKDMRDNWCVGFTRDYTVAVWVGNAGGDPMWQVSGISGAAPIWRALMDHLRSGSQPFRSVESVSSRFQRAEFGKILYPVDGAILALDPDIPEGRELVQVEAEGPGEVRLNGKLLPGGGWIPVRGKHLLSLHGPEGRLLDRVQVEVR